MPNITATASVAGSPSMSMGSSSPQKNGLTSARSGLGSEVTWLFSAQRASSKGVASKICGPLYLLVGDKGGLAIESRELAQLRIGSGLSVYVYWCRRSYLYNKLVSCQHRIKDHHRQHMKTFSVASS